MKNLWKIAVAVFGLVIIVLGVFYFLQQKDKNTQPVIESVVEQVKQPVVQPVIEPVAEQVKQPIVKPDVKLKLPEFNTIDEYVLEMNKYKTNKPNNFERATIGNGNDINVGLDGVSHSVFVLVQSDWNIGSLEDVKTFYLEENVPPACWTQNVCNEPETVNYYGPFQGKIALLLQ